MEASGSVINDPTITGQRNVTRILSAINHEFSRIICNPNFISRGGSKSDYVPHLLIKAFMHGGNNACLIDPRESHMDLLAESFYTTDKQMDD